MTRSGGTPSPRMKFREKMIENYRKCLFETTKSVQKKNNKCKDTIKTEERSKNKSKKRILTCD